MIRVLIACFFLAGCVPIPHRYNLTPSASGKLRPSTEYLLVAGETCDSRSRKFQTDAQGNFRVKALRSFAFMMYVGGHSEFWWAICEKLGPGWRKVYADREYIDANMGPILHYELDCASEPCLAKHKWGDE